MSPTKPRITIDLIKVADKSYSIVAKMQKHPGGEWVHYGSGRCGNATGSQATAFARKLGHEVAKDEDAYYDGAVNH